MSAYAYIEEDKVIIGNDYIERRFSIKDDQLVTSEIINNETHMIFNFYNNN